MNKSKFEEWLGLFNHKSMVKLVEIAFPDKKGLINELTKKELRNLILEKFDDLSIMKDVYALGIHNMKKIGDNKYIHFDSDMFLNNCDLYYIVEISDGLKIIPLSNGYGLISELKKDNNIT